MSLAPVLQSASMSSFPLSNCSFNSNNCISSIQSVNTVNNVQTQKSVSIDIWHQRLGHPSSQVLSQVVSSCNLPIVMKSKLPFCTACKLGKSHALPFPLSDSQCTKPLELIHSDLWGPSPLPSNNGHRFYVIFVDDFSRFCWFYPLQSKSEVSTIFPIFKAFVENQFSTSIKAIQIDGGTEYKPLYSVFHQHGIALRISCPYTSQQNGRAERRHRTLMELGLSILTQASMSTKFWLEAFQTANFLINRLPSTVLHGKTPFSVLYNKDFDYTFLKVFGCECFPYLRSYNHNKLEFRSSKCTFIGYSPVHKGYKCLHPSGRIYISRHVLFNETSFPFASLSSSSSSSSVSSSSVSGSCYSFSGKDSLTPFIEAADLDISSLTSDSVGSPISCTSPRPTDSVSTPIDSHSVSPSTSSDSCAITPPELLLPTHPMVTRSKVGIIKPNPKYFARSVGSHMIPKSVTEALASPAWKQAMQLEYDALMNNNTWRLVPWNSSYNVVGAKWVFKLKYNADGSIQRHKARLVAKGFHQNPGIDFHETFSPVVKSQTIRIILSLAVSHGWSIKQLDVNNAFFNGELTETVYMTQPEGFVHSQYPTHICQLVKALYGLKQAPRAWFDKLKFTLLQWGFLESKADVSLFTYSCND